MDLNTIPTDSLLAIFDRLPLECHFTTVPLVCRRWADLQPAARRQVRSLTLAVINRSAMATKSSFHWVFNQRTGFSQNLLHFPPQSFSKKVAKRLLVELPNICRLTIVQLDVDPRPIEARLVTVLSFYAHRLTSFSLHYQCSRYNYYNEPSRFFYQATLMQILSIINRKMLQLKHLLLNSDQYFFREQTTIERINSVQQPGRPTLYCSLLLPVLKRLHSFSFKSKDHIDIILYSMRQFALENDRLKLRLGVPFHSSPDKLLKNEVVCSKVDYLLIKDFHFSCSNNLFFTFKFPFSNLRSLHVSSVKNGTEYIHSQLKLKPLFTAISSLPLLNNLQLEMDKPLISGSSEALPPLPSVTSLSFFWCFDLDCTDWFGKIFDPIRVFPSLRRLQIFGDGLDCSDHFCFDFSDILGQNYKGQIIPGYQPKVKPKDACFREALEPLKLYPQSALQQILVFHSHDWIKDKPVEIKLEEL